jgi:hypothetical protein
MKKRMKSLNSNVNGAFLRGDGTGILKKGKTPRDRVFDEFSEGRGYTARQLRAPASTSRDSGLGRT